MVLVLPAIPAAAIVLLLLFKKEKLWHGVTVLGAALALIVGGIITGDVAINGPRSYGILGGLFYVDALSIIVLDIVLFIGLLSAVYAIGYMNTELKRGSFEPGRLKIYYILMNSFVFTMILALTVKNMGIMWIAIEATTLASVFLVGFNNNKQALEAAWKYIIICSVGIALALLGIILLHLSSIGVIEKAHFLDWTALYDNAPSLKAAVARLAFIFILVGFGTKAGLAPMHTWLPDAHSQAPSPISALLSGVLLNSAMYGLIRTVAIVNKTLGNSVFTGRLLMALGLLSIAMAAVFILTQKDYKRLLAYSSIEHMGIVAVALGLFTPLSVFGALLHMLNHSLTKSLLFLSSGTILQKYDTKLIAKVTGILKVLPVTGIVFFLGLFAIAGAPPFSIFSSELSIITALFQEHSFLVGAAVILLLAIVFAGIVLTLLKMFFGAPPEDVAMGEINMPGTVCLLLLLVLITATGLFMPQGLKTLLESAQRLIIGG